VSSLPVTFAGGLVPSGSVTYKSLQGNAPTPTNENRQKVAIATQTLTNFNASTPFNLPPYSVNVLFWSGGVSTGPTLQISNFAVSGITNWGATLSWTTNVPASTGVSYGTTTNYGSVAGISTALTTQHSVLVSGLANATAYDAQAFSTDGSGATVYSPNLAFSTIDSIPPRISNITNAFGTAVQNGVTVTTVNFSWNTNKPSDSQVEYGPTTAYGTLTPLNSTLTRCR
jgi:hypothetical protein